MTAPTLADALPKYTDKQVKAAIEAWFTQDGSQADSVNWEKRMRAALAAAASAVPQGEAVPVGEVRRAHFGGRKRNIGFDEAVLYTGAKVAPGTKLYATPHPAPAAAEPVALREVGLVRDVYGMCIVTVNGREVIRDNGDVIHHFASPDWFAAPTPQPVQAVPLTDDDLVAITTAYEQGFGHALRPELGNPYKAERERRSWDLGREVGMSRAVGRRITGGSNG